MTNARLMRGLPGSALLLACLSAVSVACDLPTAAPRLQPTFVVETEAVRVPVTSSPASSFVMRDLADLDPDVVGRARAGALVVLVDNASGARGTVRVRIDGGGTAVEGEVPVDGAAPVRIDIPETALRAFLSDAVVISVSGTLCPADGCGPRMPPFPEVSFRPRLEVTFEIGGES